jgi:hypothetical protein
MKIEKTKTYVLTVSLNFPQTHARKGEATFFGSQIIDKSKIHTIRSNYPLWIQRIKEVQNGGAILSIRYWSGKPYNSKQVEICQLDQNSGIGIQELNFINSDLLIPSVNGNVLDILFLSQNDGLLWVDFKEWFNGYDLKESMAIIHFTKFRY